MKPEIKELRDKIRQQLHELYDMLDELPNINDDCNCPEPCIASFEFDFIDSSSLTSETNFCLNCGGGP